MLCPQINTKHTNIDGEICQFLSVKTVGERNQQATKC